MGKLNSYILDDLTVEDYLKLREEGLPNREIAKKCYVGKSSLNRWIKRQKEAGNLPNEKMTCNTTSKIGEKINVDVYEDMRSKGKTNRYIADVVGISYDSLYKWAWREKKLGRLS